MRKFIVIILLLSILIVSGGVIFLWVGLEPTLNRFKPIIETRISHLIKKETRIDGPIKISLYPRVEVIVTDLKIKTAGKPFLGAYLTKIRFDSWPWQEDTLEISSIHLTEPTIYIQQGLQETYRVPPKKKISRPFYSQLAVDLSLMAVNVLSGQLSWKEGLRLKALKIGEMSLDEGDLLFRGKKGKPLIKLADIQLTIDGLHIQDFADLKKGWRHLLSAHPFSGKAAAGVVKVNKWKFDNFSFTARNKQGKFDFSEVTFQPTTGVAEGELGIDFQNPQIGFDLELGLNSVKLAKLLKRLKSKIKADGQLTLNMKATGQILPFKALLKNLKGSLSLKGKDLIFQNMDIDAILENYEKSQSIDLFDVTATVLFGPLGFLAFKSFDVSNIVVNGTGTGKSTIPKLRFNWKLSNLSAESVDVAFATLKNRVAARGKLDLKKMEYVDVQIALLNKKGCIEYSQTIEGPLKKPEVNSISYVGKVLVSPITTIAGKVKGLFTDSCDVFYKGAVPHPSSP